MSTLIDKLKVATGVDSRNNFNLSCFHATTSNFYVPRITYFHEFVPGEKWNLNAKCVVKTLPMIKPVIADIKVHNRFFFVPYFSIMQHWDDFLAETPIGLSDGINHPKVPWCTERTIVRVFNDPSNGLVLEKGATAAYDYQIGGKRYIFTTLGRIAFSILSGLGYAINFGHVNPSSENINGEKLSMLPLLAYLKIYLDWYNNSAFDTKLNLTMYFDLLYTTGEYNNNDIAAILKAVCQLYLEKDYFTSATLYPVGSNNASLQLGHTIKDITSSGINVISQPDNTQNHGTPFIYQSSDEQQTVSTKYSIDAVNALTDYVKRHQLAGIQPFNRVLAEYGVTLKDEELRRSTFIGDVVEDLNVMDVVNQTYADDTALGERGGLGAASGQKSLDFRNDNFGCIICVSTIVPKTSYPDGLRKHCMRTERFDFFTPSVEHLGVEPLLSAELFNRFDGSETSVPAVGNIFGYMPRYAAYKTALDSISGDFALRSRRSTLDPWILQRKFNTSDINSIKSISENFTTADPAKVNNIFADNDTDNFIIFNMWHVNSSLPMHKLFDDYQWSNEDDNPQHVTLPNQGVQLT